MKPLKIGDRVMERTTRSKGTVLSIDSLHRVFVQFESGMDSQWVYKCELTRLVKKKKPIRITSNGNNFKRQNTVTITKEQLAAAWDKYIAIELSEFRKSDDSYDFKVFCEALGFNEGEK